VRDNTALLVNNVAGVGGDEAIAILCRCKPLIRILVELLSSHDSPAVLQRLVGCVNHLSRSIEVSCHTRGLFILLPVCNALRQAACRPAVRCDFLVFVH
jgi:hypothetical protein